jgi:hypothetical protein
MPVFGKRIIVRGATRLDPFVQPHMSFVLAAARRVAGRLLVILAVFAVLGRAVASWRRRGERPVLPSLYDRYAGAGAAPRRRIGLRSVPLDRIVGTMRHPSQNTADFLPLPRLRGENWHARWQRITRATDGLAVLPPVELVQAGDEYFVVDGHNRVAAALLAGAAEIDADVIQLVLPGVTQPGQATLDASSLIGAEEVRQAGQGRRSRTVEQRLATDDLSRRELLGEARPEAPRTQPDPEPE